RRKGRQDRGKPVRFQAVFLPFNPVRIVGSANLSRLKVITHVKEVDRVLASRTERTLPLIFNPNGAVTPSMDRAALVEAGRYRQPQDVGSCGCGIAQGNREGGRYFASTADHRQLAFFPEQVAGLASIPRTLIACLSRFYHRNQAAVDFGDPRQRLLRRASFGRPVLSVMLILRA
ncbi:hypothetical protein, partial [Accumulibacter sp.]|uniref:hypothetical protein n=1 Tax=Accumulibacter sp. TaxID=2053492 RepID=UPI002586B80C